MANNELDKLKTELEKQISKNVTGITKYDDGYVVFWEKDISEEEKNIEQQVIDSFDPHIYSITCDDKFIGADGIDSTIIKIKSYGYSDTIVVNGQDVVVGLDENGYGEYEITANSPMDIDIVGKEGELAEHSLTVFAR